jgi:hypothetical protein
MRNCPAWRGGSEAEPRLVAEVIDLVDHAVDVIAQRRVLRSPCNA